MIESLPPLLTSPRVEEKIELFPLLPNGTLFASRDPKKVEEEIDRAWRTAGSPAVTYSPLPLPSGSSRLGL